LTKPSHGTDAARIAALEKRVAKLEKAAVLFEEHRQAAIDLNRQLKKFKQKWDRDDREWRAREKREKTVWDKLQQTRA
jgi:hypothetical protein